MSDVASDSCERRQCCASCGAPTDSPTELCVECLASVTRTALAPLRELAGALLALLVVCVAGCSSARATFALEQFVMTRDDAARACHDAGAELAELDGRTLQSVYDACVELDADGWCWTASELERADGSSVNLILTATGIVLAVAADEPQRARPVCEVRP